MEVAGLSDEDVQLEYTGGDRGWKGDVPGGALEHGSHSKPGLDLQRRTSQQALCVSLNSMLEDARAGRL